MIERLRPATAVPDPLFTRRTVLGLAPALWLAGAARARAAAPTLRVGLLAFGTAAWMIETIRGEGLDRAGGFALETVDLASNDAARIAFQGGAVDAIVSDLLFAARATAEGRPVVFEPFSAAEGALMVPAASPIVTIADLAGRRIGVAGGALDKSWLLLRAEAKRRHGLDLATTAEPIFGAPPLLARRLETGDLDAVLTYWSFAARLEAKGFRRLVDVGDLARAFGASGDVALLGWVFRRDFAATHGDLLDRFAAAGRAAGDRLATDPTAWEHLRPLMRAEDGATFETLKRRFLAGRPRRALAEEERDARALYAALAALGGPALVGPAKTLPDGLYRSGADGRG